MQALVAQLAAQLRQEADARIAVTRAQADARVTSAEAELANSSQLARETSDQVQRLQTTLDDTRHTLAATERTLRGRDPAIVGLHERLVGLERQLGEREAHLTSVEAKHQQARDALEHFRLASKGQRELEAWQHEQAVQTLPVELRRATDSVATKNEKAVDTLAYGSHVGTRVQSGAANHNCDCGNAKRRAHQFKMRELVNTSRHRSGSSDALRLA